MAGTAVPLQHLRQMPPPLQAMPNMWYATPTLLHYNTLHTSACVHSSRGIELWVDLMPVNGMWTQDAAPERSEPVPLERMRHRAGAHTLDPPLTTSTSTCTCTCPVSRSGRSTTSSPLRRPAGGSGTWSRRTCTQRAPCRRSPTGSARRVRDTRLADLKRVSHQYDLYQRPTQRGMLGTTATTGAYQFEVCARRRWARRR